MVLSLPNLDIIPTNMKPHPFKKIFSDGSHFDAISGTVAAVVDEKLVVGNRAGVDGNFGEGHKFYYGSVEDVGDVWDVQDPRECCGKCEKEFPGSQMFQFHPTDDWCSCYAAVRGTRPQSYATGYWAGICEA